jgi:hypothetical protein
MQVYKFGENYKGCPNNPLYLKNSEKPVQCHYPMGSDKD